MNRFPLGNLLLFLLTNTTHGFFERNHHFRIPFLRGRSLRLGKEPEDRRGFLAGSAAALSSLLIGRKPVLASYSVLEESETRRIAVFEETAPSVVFIDTFTEKQDVFSTNSMEVPLGSGSGFVWDKEGHIGTLARSLLPDDCHKQSWTLIFFEMTHFSD